MIDPKRLMVREFKLPKKKNSKGLAMTHYAVYLGNSEYIVAGPFQKREWATRRLNLLGGETATQREERLKAERAALKAATPDNIVALPKKTIRSRVKSAVDAIKAALPGGQSEATA